METRAPVRVFARRDGNDRRAENGGRAGRVLEADQLTRFDAFVCAHGRQAQGPELVEGEANLRAHQFVIPISPANPGGFPHPWRLLLEHLFIDLDATARAVRIPSRPGRLA